jgi:hypothetical protein
MWSKLLKPAIAGVTFSLVSLCAADQINFSSVPAGYTSGSIEVGAPFAGALAASPSDPTKLYVAVGSYGNEQIVLLDTVAQTTTTVATGFSSIGGIAVFANGDLAITENAGSDTILRAQDANADGDFLDPGEVTQLIAPILADGGDFTGAQVVIAPPSNAAAIPAGSLVVQTADGQTSSELLVVENPLSAPAYRPSGGAFFSGFQFNGGMAFDTAGHVIMGESLFDFSTFTSSGRIYALVNLNSNEMIEPGESHILVDQSSLAAGLSDLSVSAENDVYFTESSGSIRKFALPANLLSGTATPTTFATTNASYLSCCRFDEPTRTFAANAAPPRARLYVGGWTASWNAATNLLWLEPTTPPAAVDEWALY